MLIRIDDNKNNLGKAMDLLQANGIKYSKEEEPEGPILAFNVPQNVTTSLEKEILRVYNHNDVCMGEILADIGIDGISLERAMEIYCRLVTQIERDTFVQFYTDTPYLENDEYRIIGG